MDELVFVDLETTGYNPAEDVILEIGIVIWQPATDNIVAKDHWILQYDRGLSEEDPYLSPIYTSNGLWEASRLSDTGIEEADEEMQNFLLEYAPVLPLFCSRDAVFTRKFLASEFPGVEEIFSAGNVDVSALDGFAHNTRLFKYMPVSRKFRAIPDCLSTIMRLKYYMDQVK